ncbi:MAG TPA: DUF3108 domain-containing protein [Bacteroidia bacterium]|jgi:hypothetical protein|nr:DUF3108 domain-containing protein [Bacteroidia bacterium]
MMKKIVLIGTLITISCLSFRSAEQDLPVAENKTVDLPEIPNKAFKRGEVLSYHMRYGFIDAGVATLTVTDEEKEFAGRKTFHVVGLGNSKGTFDFFFKVRDRYETYIDEKALVPWIFVRRVSEGGYTINQDYIFNHYTNKVNVAGDAQYDIQPNMQDMLSAFYYARNLDLKNAKEGDVFTLSCFMDKEIYPLKIKFIGREDVEIDIGKFRCLKFRPIVQKGRVFKHEEDLNVWLTDDDNHIPIKGQADVLVGSIKLELTSYSNLANPISKID